MGPLLQYMEGLEFWLLWQQNQKKMNSESIHARLMKLHMMMEGNENIMHIILKFRFDWNSGCHRYRNENENISNLETAGLISKSFGTHVSLMTGPMYIEIYCCPEKNMSTRGRGYLFQMHCIFKAQMVGDFCFASNTCGLLCLKIYYHKVPLVSSFVRQQLFI